MPEIRFEAKIDEALIVPLHDAPRPHRDPLELQPLDQTLRYRDAPRMPRNTEPCPLWQFGLIAGLVLVALGAAAQLDLAVDIQTSWLLRGRVFACDPSVLREHGTCQRPKAHLRDR